MRKIPALLTLGSLLAGVAQAQEIRLAGVVQLWYTQMLDAALRAQAPAGSAGAGTPAYYPLNGAFRENGFAVRRAEVYLLGRLSPSLSWAVAFDPNISTGILADATLTWAPHPQLSVRMGQFKPLQGYEGTIVTAPNLLFYDRSMLARQFGDKWDRGAVATWVATGPGLEWRWSAGVFNGAARSADLNARKDWVARVEAEGQGGWRAGVYGLTGRSDQAEGSGTVALSLPGVGAPDAATVRGDFDATSNLGFYAVLDRGPWHAEVEAMGGRLGRRYPTLGPAPGGPAQRQHLDQRYLGWVVTAVWRRGLHALTARYDVMDYNAGNAWYGTTSPYRTATADLTPRFTEMVLGWNRFLAGEARWRTVHAKLNLVRRTGPVLLPAAGASGARAGNSLVAVLQVGF